MDYKEAMSFLEETKKYGSQLGLTSIRRLMEKLGNVQEKVPVVHIAGTNGKGSVGAMLSSVLAESGYRVGRFDTPDVFSYEEEFLMNGEPIKKERLAQLFTRVAQACAQITADGLPHPTRFEVETAAAFLWFYEEKCDIALVEVGMGGETDATNLIQKPLVSVLTAISMDHMKFLGNTLEEIAAVKAGIVKHACPVVSMQQKPEVLRVIQEVCAAKQAPLVISDISEADNVKSYNPHVSFEFNGLPFFEENLGACAWYPVEVTLGLSGTYQLENALLAIKVLEILSPKYPLVSLEMICRGLERTRWPGRFEQIGENPDFFLDGAHNEDAVRKLRQTLDLAFEDRKIIYIMGVLADKEYDRMISIMFRPGDRVFTVTPPNPRALSAKELAQLLKAQNIDAVACENAKDAVLYAGNEAGTDDVILVFGSLYYLNEIRKAYFEVQREK